MRQALKMWRDEKCQSGYSLTTVLREIGARGTREARSLSALRAVGLVRIEGLGGGSLILAPLLNY